MRSRECIPEENEGKSCSQILEVPDLESDIETFLNDSQICAGDEELPIMCPEPFAWYSFKIISTLQLVDNFL